MDLKKATFYPSITETPPFSITIHDHETSASEDFPHRHPTCQAELSHKPDDNCETLYDILVRSATEFHDAPGFGTRKLIKLHYDTKKVKSFVNGKEETEEKKWTYFEMGPYEYVTFGEYRDLVLNLGAGFRKLGLVSGDRVHVFAATCMNWLAIAHAATSQSLPIVTSYATLGESGLTTSLTQTKAKAIFADPELVSNLINPLKLAVEVKYVIYNDQNDVQVSEISALQAAHSHIQILSFSALQQLGLENPVNVMPPSPEDMACIMYTSGSTGTPKGVSLTHKNVVAAVAGINTVFHSFISTNDSVLAYLPLSHSFEYAFENCCLFWGLKVGYGNPRTLSSLSMRNCDGDIKTFRPSILIGVPTVWETLRKGVEAKVAAQGMVASSIFWRALQAKEFLCANGLPGAGTLDRLVFKTLKSETGGRLRACFNGAGSLSDHTRKFISHTLAPLVSGYGLTETCAMGTLQTPLQWTKDTIGVPSGCVEIKLLSHPDLGYRTDSTPSRGEILIRGPAVMSGYYDNDDETKQAFVQGGWFKTGDVGEWDPNGHLKIIDRVKNLIKLLGGEYVALEKLESIYRTSKVVVNVCVYASPHRLRPMAIIVPSSKAIVELAAAHNLPSDTRSAQLNLLVLKELQDVGKRAGLVNFEIVEAVVLAETEWTPESGFLTPAQKLQRRAIIAMYRERIKDVYE